MAVSEIQKLDLLAQFSQKEFFSHGSRLSHAKLDLFILIAFLLHILVVTFELIIPLNIKNPLTPPPIKVKYIDVPTSKPLKQKKTPIDSPKSKISQKKETKSPSSLASANHKAFIKKQYPEQKNTAKKKWLFQKPIAPRASFNGRKSE